MEPITIRAARNNGENCIVEEAQSPSSLLVSKSNNSCPCGCAYTCSSNWNDQGCSLLTENDRHARKRIGIEGDIGYTATCKPGDATLITWHGEDSADTTTSSTGSISIFVPGGLSNVLARTDGSIQTRTTHTRH